MICHCVNWYVNLSQKREGIWPVIWMALHNSGIGVWIQNHSRYTLVILYSPTNLTRCVMPFRSQVHTFSQMTILSATSPVSTVRTSKLVLRFFKTYELLAVSQEYFLFRTWMSAKRGEQFGREGYGHWWRVCLVVCHLFSLLEGDTRDNSNSIAAMPGHVNRGNVAVKCWFSPAIDLHSMNRTKKSKVFRYWRS